MSLSRRRQWVFGISADLDSGGSVHQDAFEHAVELAMPACNEQRVVLRKASDGASPERAQAVAEQFVRERVDLVIGHFSSAAAAAAAPVYARAGIPLLLPAATEVGLTDHATTYRVCGHDADLARVMADDVVCQFVVTRLQVVTDSTPHAEQMAVHFWRALGASELVCERDPDHTDALLFIGSFARTAAYLRQRDRTLPPHVFLSDDCVHPTLAGHLPASTREVYVYGFRPLGNSPPERELAELHFRTFGTEPAVYFAETYCTMQIALQLAAAMGQRRSGLDAALAGRTWSTVFGPLRFINREASFARFAVWRADHSGVRPVRLLSARGEPLDSIDTPPGSGA